METALGSASVTYLGNLWAISAVSGADVLLSLCYGRPRFRLRLGISSAGGLSHGLVEPRLDVCAPRRVVLLVVDERRERAVACGEARRRQQQSLIGLSAIDLLGSSKRIIRQRRGLIWIGERDRSRGEQEAADGPADFPLIHAVSARGWISFCRARLSK